MKTVFCVCLCTSIWWGKGAQRQGDEFCSKAWRPWLEFLSAPTWDIVRFPQGPGSPQNPARDRYTLPAVPSASSHPGAQISTLEFFTG